MPAEGSSGPTSQSQPRFLPRGILAGVSLTVALASLPFGKHQDLKMISIVVSPMILTECAFLLSLLCLESNDLFLIYKR